MEKITARKLLDHSTKDLWLAAESGKLKKHFTLVFDNGDELEADWKSTIYSSYGWDFHRLYPNTPLKLSHHLLTVIGEKRYEPSTMLNFLGNIVWDVLDAYLPTMDNEAGVEFRDNIAHMCYRKSNELYNDLSIVSGDEVASIDILDFCEVLDSPIVSKANDSVQPNPESIKETYDAIMNALSTDPKLYANPLAKAGRSGIVNKGQLLQCLGPRGYLTDTDSTQFKTPILRGYADGLRLFHDSLVESRSAAKALIFSKKPLQDAEYFSRRLQLMDQMVRNLHMCDCGSTNYLIWHVSDTKYDENGKQIFPGDLNRLVGKYYLDETTGKLKEILKSDKHLIGKTIKLRTVLGCQHPDPYGICSTCFGGLALTVPRGSNIGQMCCTTMTEQSSQSVLSTKHLDTSANVEPVRISPGDRKYLAPNSDSNSYLLEKSLKGKVSLVISHDQAPNITDIMEVQEVESLNISRVSQITTIMLIVNTGKIEERVTIPVGLERRMASMSYPLLKYVKKYGFKTDDRENYVIDLDKWNRSDVLLALPLRHYNLADHSRDISALLESTVKDLKKRDRVTTPQSLLLELHELVNSRLNVNLAVLEVLVYGICIQSAEEYNYHLPKPWTSVGIGVKETVMQYRSLSVTMAFEHHKDVLTSPITYLLDDRPDHQMDRFLIP